MSKRSPPKLALWLLKKCAATYQRESLTGDLIEQYNQGRGWVWCWKEVAAAILIACVRALRAAPWALGAIVLAHLLAESAVVLAIVISVDQARRAHSAAEMISRAFVRTLAVMIAVAVIGLTVSARARKYRRRHAAMNLLLLAFAVIALGVGTISWAGTLCAVP